MPRSVFDTDPAAFPALLGTAAQTGKFLYHILRSLNQHAIASNNNFLLGHTTNFFSPVATGLPGVMHILRILNLPPIISMARLLILPSLTAR